MCRTSSMFSGWTTGSVVTSPPAGIITVTSNWNPTFTPPAQTVSLDPSGQDKVDSWTKYCWITYQDYDNGFSVYSQAPGCQALYWKYCFYDASKPAPSSPGHIPAACTPDRSLYSVEPAPEPVNTPQPIQQGMTTGCNKFYLVVPGDNCQSVSRSQNVTLTDFYAWNPAVGTDCRNLQLDVYVCVGFDTRLVIPTQTPAPKIKF